MISLRSHLSYANVIATLALLFSLSGGALAAQHYLINSTKQINPKVLKQLKGAKGEAGALGQTGAPGIAGVPGTPGAPGATNVRVMVGPTQEVLGFSFGEAKCGTGERATGGGATVVGGEGQGKIVSSYPVPSSPGSTPTGWAVQVSSVSNVSSVTVTPYAVCASP